MNIDETNNHLIRGIFNNGINGILGTTTTSVQSHILRAVLTGCSALLTTPTDDILSGLLTHWILWWDRTTLLEMTFFRLLIDPLTVY